MASKKAEIQTKDVELYIIPGKEPGYKTVVTWADDKEGMPWEFVWVAPTLPPPNAKDVGSLHEAVISPKGIELENGGRLKHSFR